MCSGARARESSGVFDRSRGNVYQSSGLAAVNVQYWLQLAPRINSATAEYPRRLYVTATAAPANIHAIAPCHYPCYLYPC